MTTMPLIGIAVADLDSAVAEFTALFDLEFLTFTAGVDYPLSRTVSSEGDTAPPLPDKVRIAVDTRDTFELLELPDSPEGFRNVHLRVDDMSVALRHFRARGMEPIHDLRAGTAREVIFDSSDLHGIRLCLLQFEGESFAAALAASPRANEKTPRDA